jgi:hypothetical protein
MRHKRRDIARLLIRHKRRVVAIIVLVPIAAVPVLAFIELRPALLGIVALAALLATSGAIAVAKVRDRSFHRPEDVERHLGIAVLATVPHFASPRTETLDKERM